MKIHIYEFFGDATGVTFSAKPLTRLKTGRSKVYSRNRDTGEEVYIKKIGTIEIVSGEGNFWKQITVSGYYSSTATFETFWEK